MTMPSVQRPASGPTQHSRPSSDASEFGLAALTDDQLRRLERDAREVSSDSGGLAPLFEALVGEAAIERRGRAAGGEPDISLELPDRIDGDPLDVVFDQRDAMVRAIDLRDDTDRSDGERIVWSVVVERLATMRHGAKEELADRRRHDPDEETQMDVSFQRAALARQEESHELDEELAREERAAGTEERAAGAEVPVDGGAGVVDGKHR